MRGVLEVHQRMFEHILGVKPEKAQYISSYPREKIIELMDDITELQKIMEVLDKQIYE